ncbi:MAG TPA: sigma-70 family RNA polymerase sigma factor [Candidatus Angelobacter sp.]|nr:sigma-70 family RNA polymerase sigma factor [Candidatus Angelobacter sp.]
MLDSFPEPISQLIERWKTGDREVINTLFPLIYRELRSLAHWYMRGERPNHTLQTTALVHEAYLRLAQQGPFQTQSREQLVAVAAMLMRQILVDSARAYRAEKRGAGLNVQLDEEFELTGHQDLDIIALDDALHELSRLDPQQGRIVELRCFGGLTVEETAAILGISTATTKRDWSMAKAWLTRELRRGGDGTSAGVGQN